jgi:hypothetical protein
MPSSALIADLPIYSVKLAAGPLPDSVFDPLRRLKRETFVRGEISTNGIIRIPDAKDQMLIQSKLTAQAGALASNRAARWFRLIMVLLVAAPPVYIFVRKWTT